MGEQSLTSAEAESALKYARKWAYRSDDPTSWSNLAAAYATASSPRLALARKWYAKAAHRRDPRGMFEYGLMLLHGEGGAVDLRRGRKWLQAAARVGQIDALKVLCHALQHGEFGFLWSPQRLRAPRQALRRADAALRRRVRGRE